MTGPTPRQFVIGTAGHVDHGKSTLVKALTGIDPDRLAEEKARAMTIDLGFAWLTLPSGREVSVVDVPGHERFVKNMLAGVAASTPRSWSWPPTRGRCRRRPSTWRSWTSSRSGLA